jgi:CheY-like chemotaxis protein
MKMAPIVEAIGKVPEISSLLVHTGQHYDEGMSDVFFRDLGMPRPDLFLGVGSGSHAEQTARIMVEFERVCLQEKPDLVILDIMMAYILEGLDIRRQMAADPTLKNIPVIMLTSLTGERVQRNLPSDEYVPESAWLHKPIDPDKLLEQVKKAIG